MARTNKYASLNFNDIYEKKVTNSTNSNTRSSFSSHSSASSSSSSSSSLTGLNRTVISNSRIHGHMLVLSRPTPKPITVPPKSNPSQKAPPASTTPGETGIKSVKVSDQTVCEPDSISLRPQGRTGSGSPVLLSPLPSPGNSPSPLGSPLFKSDRFVPPHRRPGFSGQEVRSGSELVKGGQGKEKGHIGSPNRYVDEGRPKSGGGYEKMRRNSGEAADSGAVLSRPGSSGGRPRSSGGRMF